MRRYGDAPVPGTNYIHRPGAYGIIMRDGDLLITEQADELNEFQLPGGGIDPGEQPIPALHREAYEETGWTIAVNRKLGAFVTYVYMPDYDLYARKVSHIYLCRAIVEKSEPIEQSHFAVWMTPEMAAQRVANPGDRAFVRSLLL